MQAVVLDVEGVPAESRAVREQDALGARRRDVDQRPDPVGAVADVDRLGLGDLRKVGVVDVELRLDEARFISAPSGDSPKDVR
jgi:hypothetical protein